MDCVIWDTMKMTKGDVWAILVWSAIAGMVITVLARKYFKLN